MQKSHGKVKTNARVHGKASKVDDEAAEHMHSVHVPIDKVGYTSESPRGMTSTASRRLAPVRSQEQDRHASLPFRSSIVRMAQMVVQWVIQAQWRSLLIKWKLIQLWRVRVGVKLSCRGRRIFHGSEEKRTGNELVSEMAKIFPACATKTPAKTLATQRVSFWMRMMTCWTVPWRIDKGPIACDRRKRFLQNERRRADLQNVASDFLIFALGLSYDLSKFCDDFTPFFRLWKTITKSVGKNLKIWGNVL